MAKIKLKWRVCPAPTGRFSSFEKRGWPHADFMNGESAAFIMCDESYEPSAHKDADNLELKVLVAQWNEDPTATRFVWRTLKQRAKSIKEAKEMASTFVNSAKGKDFVHFDYRG